MRGDGSCVLIDFELFVETRQQGLFERDLDIMGRCIRRALLERILEARVLFSIRGRYGTGHCLAIL